MVNRLPPGVEMHMTGAYAGCRRLKQTTEADDWSLCSRHQWLATDYPSHVRDMGVHHRMLTTDADDWTQTTDADDWSVCSEDCM